VKRALALLILMPLLAAARDLPAPVREALARAGVPDSGVAAIVVPVERGAPPVVAHNPEQPMNPASVMKLVTAYAALDLLGPAFTFKTDFLATADLSAGVLEGDLFIRGGGDPKLTADRLWLALHELRSRGVREIRGDIVIDRSVFAPAAFDPAKFDNDPRRAYNVGPDAFLVNFHAVEFRFVPEPNAVRVVAQPDLPNVEVVSRIKPAAGPCTWWRGDLKHQFIENGLVATAVFEGSYPVACGENTWSLSVFDGPRFAESVLRWLWSESGGKLRGKVRDGKAPPEARLLMRAESEPLSNLVRDMNKFSNNVMARNIFLALSAQQSGVGETRASAKIVREWLATRGIDAPGFSIENGAGLSRDDRITAGTLAALLQRAWATALMPEIASSMPVFATDGTLRKRASPAAGQAHLKGGTLTGVQSMAGYVVDRGGRRWVVVMMANHPKANAAQPALDALVGWVHEGGGSRAPR
jgi:D-alanyl-D-alanine carboxypeptidase/D-alanyl-D-alanine-endopeptidase (penicillin-binding protein 4)